MTPRTILVTGGGGFLGAHIVDCLLDTIRPGSQGTKVAVISRNPATIKDCNDRASYHAADICNEAQMRDLFEELSPNAVIHAASPRPWALPSELEKANVEGTKILLRVAASTASTKAFIYTSSDSALHHFQHLITETEAVRFGASDTHKPYGRSKALAEAMVAKADAPGALRTVILRVPMLYGERDNNLSPALADSIRKGEHRIQVGSNDKFFEHCYVKNAAEAHVLAVDAVLEELSPTNKLVADGGKQAGQGVAGESFFISDGQPRRFWDFIRECFAELGHPVEKHEVKVVPLWLIQSFASASEWFYWIFTLGTTRPKNIRENMDYFDGGCRWDITKAKERLRYEPVPDQREAIRWTMQWTKEALM